MKKLAPLLFLFFAFGSCKKSVEPAPVTVPVSFTGTSYASLSTYDTFGKPANLLSPRDVISTTMSSFISSNLIENRDLRKTQPELFSKTAIADIKVVQKSTVTVTFVSQSAGLPNALAFYTYATDKPPASAKDIEKITYLFPNAGNGTKLVPGDKVRLGTFEPGTSIGFVIIQKGWNPVTKTTNNDGVHFCSNDVLNPEIDPALKKHAVLIDFPEENKVLVGFEDVNRTDPTCNHDFNDVMFYTTVSF